MLSKQTKILKKGNQLYSIAKGKCPRCHEGEFFKHAFTLHPGKITQLHKNCSYCDLKYMIEPSFFYGAMYVNYALTVAVIVSSFIIAKVFVGLEILPSFVTVAIASVIASPFNLRLSRILWIHMFVKYEGDSFKKNA